MEKVAALRQLFAEYGYVGGDAGPGMDKEAMNRLMKYLAQVGPKKFKSVWKKSLQRVYNSLHSRMSDKAYEIYKSKSTYASLYGPKPISEGTRAASGMLSTLKSKDPMQSNIYIRGATGLRQSSVQPKSI
jgi:hypothetical protein